MTVHLTCEVAVTEQPPDLPNANLVLCVVESGDGHDELQITEGDRHLTAPVHEVVEAFDAALSEWRRRQWSPVLSAAREVGERVRIIGDPRYVGFHPEGLLRAPDLGYVTDITDRGVEIEVNAMSAPGARSENTRSIPWHTIEFASTASTVVGVTAWAPADRTEFAAELRRVAKTSIAAVTPEVRHAIVALADAAEEGA